MSNPYDLNDPVISSNILGIRSCTNALEEQRRARMMLSRALNIRKVTAFVGSGVSRAYGHPGWEGFAGKVIRGTLSRMDEENCSGAEIERLAEFVESIEIDNDRTQRKKPIKQSGKNRIKQAPQRPLQKKSEKRQWPRQLYRSDRFLLYLGICQDLFERHVPNGRNAFYELAASAIKPGREQIPDLDPVQTVIRELDISHFMTTNYDGRIEAALKIALDRAALGKDTKELSIGKTTPEEMKLFAARAPGFERAVFHLHGAAGDWKNMIVTERDYQRLYLSGDPERRGFREALNLAFSANPVVFLGSSMQEPDLLRPLREFVSEMRPEGPERPLFALIAGNFEDSESREFSKFLHSRYDVKTIFYQSRGDPTKAFCEEIRKIAGGWQDWWGGWQKKPAIRRPNFRRADTGDLKKWKNDSNLMIHHATNEGQISGVSVDGPGREEFDEIKALVESNRVVLVVGRSGTGKGGLAAWLARTVAAEHREKRVFFGTTHFSNDFISLLRGAIAHITGRDQREGAEREQPEQIDRFKNALLENNALVVIGGLERLLVASAATASTLGYKKALADEFGKFPLETGRPISREIEKFLEAVMEIANMARGSDGCACKLVLTSTLWPDFTFGASEQNQTDARPSKRVSRIEPHRLKGLMGWSTERDAGASSPQERKLLSLCGFEGQLAEEDALLDALRSLNQSLRGHWYALSVVGKACERIADKKAALTWLNTVVAKVTPAHFSIRPVVALTEAQQTIVESLAKTERVRTRYKKMLQHVALCSTPISAESVCHSFPQKERTDVKMVRKCLDNLVECKLLLRIVDPIKSVEYARYTAHTLVRILVQHQLGASRDALGEPQRLELGGFSRPFDEELTGTVPGHEQAGQALEGLLQKIDGMQGDELLTDEYRDHVRAAFGYVRARWTATSIARLEKPDFVDGIEVTQFFSHQRRLSKVLNAVRRHATRRDLFWEYEDDKPESRDGILYLDELSWLYNELGICTFCQGTLRDAGAFFRLGEHVNRYADRPSRSYRWCHSQLNLGVVELETGHLEWAKDHLVYAYVEGKERLKDKDLESRAGGYLALIHHLMGDYDRATDLYLESVKTLQLRQNRRGLSIFSRHLADLYRLRKQPDAAAKALQDSVAAAEAGRHTDQLHYARIAESNATMNKEPSKALRQTTQSLEFARKIGMPKLEADALKVQAHIALQHGEYEQADQLIARCLGIATQNGMGLRKTAALVTMGRIARLRGRYDEARKILEAAVAMGTRQGYQLQVELAHEQISEM